MKLKELHGLMQGMEPFDPGRLKVQLEQYPTGADIASRMLFTARHRLGGLPHRAGGVGLQIESMFNDFKGKVVADLGCGTGMLSAGAALLGSPAVVGIDVDGDALDVALHNVERFEDPLPVDFIRADVLGIAQGVGPASTSSSGAGGGGGGGVAWRRLQCDTVVMNPPFGTRRKGADVEFLRAAAALVGGGGGTVYSLHKSSTRGHIHGVVQRELGCTNAEVLAELRYDLPATYKFHRERSRDIEVDLWRFVLPPGSGGTAWWQHGQSQRGSRPPRQDLKDKDERGRRR